MMITSSNNGNGRYSHTKIKRSILRNRSRAGDLRFSTKSYSRSTRFSASRLTRDLNLPRNTSISRARNATIGAVLPYRMSFVTRDQVLPRHKLIIVDLGADRCGSRSSSRRTAANILVFRDHFAAEVFDHLAPVRRHHLNPDLLCPSGFKPLDSRADLFATTGQGHSAD